MDTRTRRFARSAGALAIAVTALAAAGQASAGAAAQRLAGTWRPLPAAPVQGEPVALAYDPPHGQLIALLDQSSGSVTSTAVLQGGTWRTLAAPDPLTAGELVYDPAVASTVAVGSGFDGLCAARWTGTGWTAPSCAAPSPLAGGDVLVVRAAAYDGTRARLLVTGDLYAAFKADSYEATETWTWDGSTWARLDPAQEAAPVTGPAPAEVCPDVSCTTLETANLFRFAGAAVWLPGARQVVLDGDGGRTWTWDGSTWHAVHPPAAPDCGLGIAFNETASTVDSCSGSTAYRPSIAWDVATGTAVLHAYPGITARWNGTAWTPMVTGGINAPVWGPVAYDASLGGVVMLGPGNGVSRPRSESTLWVLGPAAG